MMKVSYYHIDAFANKLFSGNPAGVCFLPTDQPDSLLQAIAVENNLSVTSFVEDKDSKFAIRWFTPDGELNLCGHGTTPVGKIGRRDRQPFPSPFCMKRTALTALHFIIANADYRYLLLSYNNDSVISHDAIVGLLTRYGEITIHSQPLTRYCSVSKHHARYNPSQKVVERLYHLKPAPSIHAIVPAINHDTLAQCRSYSAGTGQKSF